MNQEELALFIELQPRLLEFLGEWQEGDRYIFSIDTVNPYVEHYCAACDGRKGYLADVLWLPLPIDPADPERITRGEKPRGLWNMIDWNRFTCSPNEDGTIDMYERYDGDYDSNRWHCLNENPPEALLRALKAQWEVKNHERR